jgi:hypothetical protein
MQFAATQVNRTFPALVLFHNLYHLLSIASICRFTVTCGQPRLRNVQGLRATLRETKMRLIRTSVILLGLLALIPNPPVDKNAPPDAAPSNWALMSAASSAFQDVKTFCTRQASVCDTADYLITRVEVKAKYGFKLVYEWANSAKNEVQAALEPRSLGGSNFASLRPAADEIMTGSIQPLKDLRGTVED